MWFTTSLIILLIAYCTPIWLNRDTVEAESIMNAIKLMYITVPTKEIGVTIARALVQDKLAACVNIMNGGVESYYMWEGCWSPAMSTYFLSRR